jgi:hypothetical protein
MIWMRYFPAGEVVFLVDEGEAFRLALGRVARISRYKLS